MSISPIAFPGDDGAGGPDSVAGDVAAAVASSQARRGELESAALGQGGTIGNVLDLPPGPDAASKHIGGPDTGYPT